MDEPTAQKIEESGKKRARNGKSLIIVILLILMALGASGLAAYLRYKKTHITTDDAFVDGRIFTVASRVPGKVLSLQVKDNQLVKRGDLLLEMDPMDYEVQVSQASAGLETERRRLFELTDKVEMSRKQTDEIAASLEAARADLALAQANLQLTESDLSRAEMLYNRQVIPREQYDKSKNANQVAAARVRSAESSVRRFEASLETQRATIRQAERTLPTQQAQIEQRQAALKAAKLSAEYTRIYAPADGYITKRNVEAGNQIQTGQPLMAIVPLSQVEIWITANYKETQLERVRPGQKVVIEVDTYPGKKFSGTVESIMAGTGAAFSLFPPENATGNYVKVVQRIPVKIVLAPGEDPGHVLRIGMSVRPTILVNS